MERTDTAERSAHRVLMISAGMRRPKKQGNPFAACHRYLNYGLLGLATRLAKLGHEPRVFHGHFEEPERFVRGLDEAGWLHTRAPVFLSIPSSYALDWAAAACREIRRRAPAARIVIGGRWVVAQDGAWIRRHIPEANLVVYGLADELLEQIMRPASWRLMPNNDLSEVPASPETAAGVLSELDYRLLDGYDDFTPSFEVSRGCGRGCKFCAEAGIKLSNMKCPQALASEIAACQQVYGRRDIRAFFEASMFMPSADWGNQLRRAFDDRGIDLHWRTETRVDHLSPERVKALAGAGLRVLDLGLESASPRQLQRMSKTQNTPAYLRKASDLLRACHDEGIWAKVNVLLYPGEDDSTVAETRAWLDEHARYIKGVSAGPMILYRYGDTTADSLREMKSHGATAVDEAALDRTGFTDLHLSKAMNHARSEQIARDISRSLMSARDYFDLKSFSYFQPALGFDRFMDIARKAAPDELPFSVNEDVWVSEEVLAA
ncbi:MULTISPECIES: radical SAM protein [unclassified Rubrivivax]|uniref:B12-binding domain-containing radical SAM protein n=1 Tax=unclassified Rubrivivax TaxID=2649762 RepID=UPI001E34B85D|nr:MULTISPECIES: radical SAM protein [unclassified Rubrivivax]MCC9597766.1 radical SAM protein [Rubrivivax sp. JA1055]MCC9645977.1 radical SAM protein [Rubrivivax sp. JA1029]